MLDIEPDTSAAEHESALADAQEAMEAHWTGRANEYLARLRDLASPEVTIRDVASIRVAVLDTHVVNAVSYVYEDGSSLILINDALVVLAYEFCRALASQVTLGDDAPKVTREEAAQTLTAQLDWMRLASVSQSIPLDLTGQRIQLAGMMALVIEYFLLGHEVAHVALGHHRGCLGARSLLIEIGDVPAPSSVDEGTATSEPLEEEQVADWLAVMMVLETLNSDAVPLVDVLAGMAAIYAFVRFLAVLEAAIGKQSFPAAVVMLNEQSHPSAHVRAEQIGLVLRTQISNGEEVWNRVAEIGRAWTSIFESLGDATERENAAARTMEEWFEECTGGVVPDYVTFRSKLLAARRNLIPSLLAVGVQVVASFEKDWEDPPAEADVEISEVDLDRFRFWFERSKLVLNARDYLDQSVQAAWYAMYRRYGGSAFSE